MWLPSCVIVGTTAISVSALNIAKSKPTKSRTSGTCTSSTLSVKRLPVSMCTDSHLTANINRLLTDDPSRRLTAPVIFSKEHLFGNSNNEVQPDNYDLDSIDADEIESDSRKRLRGVQRVAPSSLVRKQKDDTKASDGSLELTDVDDSDESFEMVDKFRFNIDADALRDAILKKSKLKGRQQLSLSQSDQSTSDNLSEEITFNQSLLDKLASGEAIIDDSGENTVIRLVLDHDDFAAMVDSNSDSYTQGDESEDDDDENDLMYSAEAVYVDRKERAERKKSMEYSELKMREAERFINREIKSESSKENIFNREQFLEGYRDKGDDENADVKSKSLNKEDMIIERIRRMKVEKEIQKNKPKPRQYLADMSKNILLENIYGTAVIGFSLAAAIFLFDSLSVLFLSIFKSSSRLILDSLSISYSKRIQWQRSAKPLLLISILFCRCLILLVNHIRNFNRFSGVGYREGQTVKQSSGFFRSKFDDGFRFLKKTNKKS